MAFRPKQQQLDGWQLPCLTISSGTIHNRQFCWRQQGLETTFDPQKDSNLGLEGRSQRDR